MCSICIQTETIFPISVHHYKNQLSVCLVGERGEMLSEFVWVCVCRWLNQFIIICCKVYTYGNVKVCKSEKMNSSGRFYWKTHEIVWREKKNAVVLLFIFFVLLLSSKCMFGSSDLRFGFSFIYFRSLDIECIIFT